MDKLKVFESNKWDEFYKMIVLYTDYYHSSYGKRAIRFFRGVGNETYTLIPSIFRLHEYTKYKEACIYYEFCAHAGNLLHTNMNSWDIAFTMQHHGIQTRFLDWTESFSVALHFALASAIKNEREKAVVWALDPYVLNECSYKLNYPKNNNKEMLKDYKQKEVLDLDADFQLDYFQYFILDPKDLRYNPEANKLNKDIYAIYPRRRSDRLRAQSGMFTLHNIEDPLEEKYPNLVIKFILTREGFENAQKYLDLAGINEYTLFPDLDGLSRYFKERYRD